MVSHGEPALRARGKTALSFFVFAVGVVVTLTASWLVHKNVENEARLRFERQASEARHSIDSRVQSYTDIMYGMRALFRSAQFVSSAQFHNYVSGLDLSRRFPGFLNLNYAEQVPAERRRAYEARMRGDRLLAERGYPPFRIMPPGNREYYHVITYLEPVMGNESSFGRDVVADPQRRAAFERQVLGTSEVSSSGRPIQIPGPNPFWGIAMRLPVDRPGMPGDTREQQLAALMGSLGAGIRVSELIENVLGPAVLRSMRFKVYEAGPASQYAKARPSTQDLLELFDSAQPGKPAGTAGADAAPGHELQTVIPLMVAGRTWELHFSAPMRAMISSGDAALPWLVLGGGLLISLLLFGTSYSLA